MSNCKMEESLQVTCDISNQELASIVGFAEDGLDGGPDPGEPSPPVSRLSMTQVRGVRRRQSVLAPTVQPADAQEKCRRPKAA